MESPASAFGGGQHEVSRVETAWADEPAGPAREADPQLRIDPVVIHHAYRLTIGPWSFQFTMPSGLDLLDLGDRARGLMGMLLIIGVAYYLSDDPVVISGKRIIRVLALQWILAIFVLRTRPGIWLGEQAGLLVESLLGRPVVDRDGPWAYLYAILVLPTIVYASALFAILYRLGIMQVAVRGFAATVARLTATSGVETLHAAATVIVGPTEASLAIRPYLPRLTKSELLTVTAVGMANVSGLVAAAYMAFGFSPRMLLVAALVTTPGALLLTKLLIPEADASETFSRPGPEAVRRDPSMFAAVVRGTYEGLMTALAVAAALIAVVGLITLLNLGLDRFDASVQAFFGWALAPVAYMLGVGWEDCRAVGGVLGTRTVLNELIAFQELGRLRGVILDRSYNITSFALCGFANFGTLGVQLAGIAALAPGRRRDLLEIGLRALLAATLANLLTACIAGVLL